MPIGYARLETIKRTADWGALCKLGYIARRGKFAGRGDLIAGPITVLPPNAPARFKKGEVLWLEADQSERIGQLAAIEIVIALPDDKDLTRDDLIAIARSFAMLIMQQFGVAITFAIHSANDDHEDPARRNPHAHLLVTSRAVTPKGLAPRRIASLLPTCTGRRTELGTLPAVLDAAPIATMYGLILELFRARHGKDGGLDLPAPHAQYHIGPVSAYGAAIANAHAIASRPDAAAIFRKLDRIEFNAEIRAHNVASIRRLPELIEHLSAAPFTRRQLEDLVRRFISGKEEADAIIADVLEQTHCFEMGEPDASTLLVTARYLERERAIAAAAAALAAGSPPLQGEFETVRDFVGSLGGSVPAFAIVEAERHLDLAELAGKIADRGHSPVFVTHLAKSRALPADMPVRPLHWQDAFRLEAGEIGIVEEADALTATDLERVLNVARDAGAAVLLVRRPPRPGWRRNALLDAISSRLGHARIGVAPTQDAVTRAIARESLPDLVAALAQNQRCRLAATRAEQIENALSLIRRTTAAGKKIHVLCPDRELSASLVLACARARIHAAIGPSVPADHSGPVLVLHGTGRYGARLLPQLMMRDVYLLAARTETADLSTLARHLAYADDQVTSLVFPTRAYRVSAGWGDRGGEVIATRAFELVTPHMSVEPSREDRHLLSLLDELAQEVGVGFGVRDWNAAAADREDDFGPEYLEEDEHAAEFDSEIEPETEPPDDPPVPSC